MNSIKQLYHFLGSIYFAIILFALTGFLAVAGTFLEAYSDSHLFSAYWTYQHPIFLMLIYGFFINILFSALRRWPFQKKHIPFLMTHLGLLMLLTGVIIKSYFGKQGSMSLIEGGSSQRIFMPNTYSLHLEKRDPKNPEEKIQIDKIIQPLMRFDDIEIRPVDFSPNGYEWKETWIKGDQLIIAGLKPIAVGKAEDFFHSTNKVRFHHENSTPWNVIAVSTHNIAEIAKQLYLQDLSVEITDLRNNEKTTKMLKEALASPIHVNNQKIAFSISWNFSHSNDSAIPFLTMEVNGEKMMIALSGPDSLINKNISAGKIPFVIDLSRQPTFLCIQDEQKNDYLFFFNSHGEIYSTVFNNDNLQSILVYDDGFKGYAVQTSFPFEDFPSGRHEKEQAELFRIAVQLRQNLEKNSELATPLAMLRKAAETINVEFTQLLLRLLQSWDKSSHLLFDSLFDDSQLKNMMYSLNWNKIPLQEQYACGWLCILFDEMEKEIGKGKNFPQILKERGWPLASHFSDLDDLESMANLFAQQLFAASDQLPQPNLMPNMQPLKALSAYLRAYGITLPTIRQPLTSHQLIRIYHAARLYHDRVRKILSPLEHQPTAALAQLIESMSEESRLLIDIKKAYVSFVKHLGQEISGTVSVQNISKTFVQYAPLNNPLLLEDEAALLTACLNSHTVVLETPITLNMKKITALKKWEDNHPLIGLEIKKGQRKEYIHLIYDKYGMGLAWPILDGEYLIRYQPLFIELPYKVRLHDARQINYPGTQQSYSYESDIIVTDLINQTREEKTISMNNVHETHDGYRFYLANLSPSDEIAPQRVQIVVNHDPAKYILTYPGAFFLSLGIVLLFWMKPYKQKDEG